MLNILGRPQTVCGGVSRRELLQVAGAGLFGMSLPRLLHAEESHSPVAPRAKSVIFLYLFGGPSQLETFDLKPKAPNKIRGPYLPIASRTPDLLISEKLEQCAAISDKFAVVRTLSHSFNDHSGGGHYVQTGKRWHIPIGAGFNATPQDWPSIGSVVEYLSQHKQHQFSQPRTREEGLPNYVVVPNSLGKIQTHSVLLQRPGEYGGWLGRGYDPITTSVDKKDAKDNPYYRICSDEELTFQIDGLISQDAMTLDRLGGRQSLLAQFDQKLRQRDAQKSLTAYDRFQQRALSLVASEKTRKAMDLRQESDNVRDRYGRHLFGQSTLMARRLVEAGVRYVTVHWDAPDGYGWDSHLNSKDVGDHLMPGFDQTFSALLIDLEERGLLDETLVVCLGEMGRTPLANANWGRDHWSTLFPALVAGAGVRGGIVLGQSDKDAAYALTPPYKPEDFAATIYHALGIDPEIRLPDGQGRPVGLVEDGKPILELFG
ncbi:DUF1501 domain-containing protein [Schlesneria sp.]|uniref:DUF1501 domain-containing protein n=1 Tax=Schlesneria sp. TaxID=2762018 RepID=UPI002F1E26B9